MTSRVLMTALAIWLVGGGMARQSAPMPVALGVGPKKAAAKPAAADKKFQPELVLEYLLKHQAEDGSWPPGTQVNPDACKGITVATTALAAMALVDYRDHQPKEMDAAVTKALAFVLKNVYREPESSLPGFGSPAWGQIYTLELMSRLLGHEVWKNEHDKLRKELAEVLDWLYQGQNNTGGWGYDGTFKIAAALIALQNARKAGAKIDEEKYNKGVELLFNQRSPDRGYAYGFATSGAVRAALAEEKAMEDGAARVVECEWAMLRAGKVERKDLDRAFEMFMKHRAFVWKARALLKEGKVLRQSGASPYCWFAFFGYYYSALGLGDVSKERRKDWADALRADLLKVMDATGTWINVEFPDKKPKPPFAWPENPAPGSKIYSSAMALMAFKALDRATAAEAAP